nr:ATP-dependent DNA helicase RecG [Corynebacterium sp. TAE3-ERU12]
MGWARGATASTQLADALGAETARTLRKGFGVSTVGELLTMVPPRYLRHDDGLGVLEDGQVVTAIVRVANKGPDPTKAEVDYWKKRGRGRRLPHKPWMLTITDGTQFLAMPVFGNHARVEEIDEGAQLLVMGTVRIGHHNLELANADFINISDPDDAEKATGRLGKLFATAHGVGELLELLARPSLPLHRGRNKVAGITLALYLHRLMQWLPAQPEPLPQVPPGLPSFDEALRGLQFPPAGNRAEELIRKRLKYDEALELQLATQLRRVDTASRSAEVCPARSDGMRDALTRGLPFELTDGQLEVISAIDADLGRPTPMNRLLQGEVGSGKTVVAAMAMARVVDAGRQCALLAPTEVLAAQHARTLAAMFDAAGCAMSVMLLTGSLSTADKRAALLAIMTGEVDVIVGTHALFSDGVEFFDLGLVVIDEQHRFGVRQRDRLRERARGAAVPHVLVMTATPIPRTIAMTFFGDLDTSTLRQLPAGRREIDTVVVPVADKPHWHARAWARIGEEVAAGNRAFVVCPKIHPRPPDGDEEHTDPGESLLEVYEQAEQALPGVRVGMLHGQLPAAAKDEVMRAFAEGEIDVLVSTTVVEVGVDVPEATVMMIRQAESFGVSQLHQLRGRIGRGGRGGLCFLCTYAESGSPERQRLQDIAATNDGFELAELDLRYRSHGDVLGDEQSGAAGGLGLLDLSSDRKIIEYAATVAQDLVAQDIKAARALTADITEEESDYLDRG